MRIELALGWLWIAVILVVAFMVLHRHSSGGNVTYTHLGMTE